MPSVTSKRATAPGTAFVTGAAQGIGLACVARLARGGWRVVGLDLQEGRLQAAMKELQAQGLDARGVSCDICDRSAVVNALSPEPRIDAMVCAAGIYNDAPLMDLTESAFRQMLEVNVVGTFIPAQEAARRMQAGGRIVTISSRGALGGTRFAHYVASKAAVIGLTRAMAMELRPRQIAVNSVAPGFTDSVLHRQILSPYDIEHEYGLVGGNIFHGELTMGQMFHARPAAGYADLRTPVRGLYQAGSATHGGGGVTGVPGRNVVSQVLADRRRASWRERIPLGRKG